jgi:hypothetical protein
MPVVLLVLFAIALLTMFAGLFLSPRSRPQTRNVQDDYQVARPRQRVVAPTTSKATTTTTAIPSVSRATATTTAIPLRAGRIAVRASAVSTGTVEQMPRARRGAISYDEVSVLRQAPPPRARRSNASVVHPGFEADRLIDRVGSWKVAIPGLMAIFLLGFYLFSLLIPHQLLWMTILFNQQPAVPKPTPTVQVTYTASTKLVRLSQLNVAQYQSLQEYNTWAYSACSAASMTEVIDSYGHNYRITDILKIESQIHEITPSEGLLEESGIQHTGTQFGFTTVWGHNLSLNQVIAAANSGTPVIVSFPPDRYAGGHILVVRGGNANYVDLADSSLYNRTQVTRAFFLNYWEGFYAIMTPNK